MHWNDPSNHHQVSHSMETTLCDQCWFLCHLILSFVISWTTPLELWQRYNSPILCCGVQSPIAHWHHFCTMALVSGLLTVRNIVFVSDKHTLVFQPSLTLYVLPLVTESTILTSFHYPHEKGSSCIPPFEILLRFWPSSCCKFVFRFTLTAFLRELQYFAVTIFTWVEPTFFVVDCPPGGSCPKFVAVSVTGV